MGCVRSASTISGLGSPSDAVSTQSEPEQEVFPRLEPVTSRSSRPAGDSISVGRSCRAIGPRYVEWPLPSAPQFQKSGRQSAGPDNGLERLSRVGQNCPTALSARSRFAGELAPFTVTTLRLSPPPRHIPWTDFTVSSIRPHADPSQWKRLRTTITRSRSLLTWA